MSQSLTSRELLRDKLLLKWNVALLVPLIVFNFIWNGALIVNQTFNGFLSGNGDTFSLIQAAIFMALFYLTIIALAGYLVAADSGRRGMLELWLDILVFAIVPLLFIDFTNNLIIGLALCVIVWVIYFLARGWIQKLFKYRPPAPLGALKAIDETQKALLADRAVIGSFWFATIFALIWLVADLIFYFTGALTTQLLILTAGRTILLPVAGYFLGKLSGRLALSRVIVANKSNGNNAAEADDSESKRRLALLATSRASEEAKDLVPNDLPLRSSGAQRFFLLLLLAFAVFYPILDPYLFGYGTVGRISGYGDAGYYVILALGLNIVVGFAGLLDLGYVAFFAIGAYAWGVIGSPQLGLLLNINFNLHLLPLLFWPMIIGAGIIAAFWGVVLGAPTLRLRGDYLAIVTLGFGEIVPIIFLELDKYTNGTNGLVGIRSPGFFGIDWTSVTPIPYYYLILALIAVSIFANVRLRDSRMGRAWVAIREDEIAAASSGVNLVNTKLFAFGAGAFFSGIAGMYHSAKLGTISPDAFGFGDSVIYLAMVVIGGIGSIPGVIVGALTVYAVNLFILNQLDTLASDPTNIMFTFKAQIVQFVPGFTFGNIRNLVFGIILVVIMIFRPEGLIPSARRRRELHRSQAEEVEIGSLDPPPGSPEFESEIHVS